MKVRIPMRKVLLIFMSIVICLSGYIIAWAITPEEALQHIGEKQTVCGTVASTHFARSSKGQPTFLNLDKPYPNQIFTIMIWGNKRGSFNEAPEKYYSGKRICVTGSIKNYRGSPEIVVNNPSQIKE